eukprot:scaffold371_cov273-Pinguiococcus_pyrenoidosus.AAC.1
MITCTWISSSSVPPLLLPGGQDLEGQEGAIFPIIRHKLAVDDERARGCCGGGADGAAQLRVLLGGVLTISTEDHDLPVVHQMDLSALAIVLQLRRERLSAEPLENLRDLLGGLRKHREDWHAGAQVAPILQGPERPTQQRVTERLIGRAIGESLRDDFGTELTSLAHTEILRISNLDRLGDQGRSALHWSRLLGQQILALCDGVGKGPDHRLLGAADPQPALQRADNVLGFGTLRAGEHPLDLPDPPILRLVPTHLGDAAQL